MDQLAVRGFVKRVQRQSALCIFDGAFGFTRLDEIANQAIQGVAQRLGQLLLLGALPVVEIWTVVQTAPGAWPWDRQATNKA